MSIKLDYTDKEVQKLIRIFCPKYHCLKVYNVANQVYIAGFDGDYVLFQQHIRTIILEHSKKELTLNDVFSIRR